MVAPLLLAEYALLPFPFALPYKAMFFFFITGSLSLFFTGKDVTAYVGEFVGSRIVVSRIVGSGVAGSGVVGSGVVGSGVVGSGVIISDGDNVGEGEGIGVMIVSSQASPSKSIHVTCLSSSGIVSETAKKGQVRLSSMLPPLFETSTSPSMENSSTKPNPTTLFPQKLESEMSIGDPKLLMI